MTLYKYCLAYCIRWLTSDNRVNTNLYHLANTAATFKCWSADELSNAAIKSAFKNKTKVAFEQCLLQFVAVTYQGALSADE